MHFLSHSLKRTTATGVPSADTYSPYLADSSDLASLTPPHPSAERRSSLPSPDRSFGRTLGFLVLSVLAGQGLVLLVSPLLTRLYSPRHFGVVGVYISILTIANVLHSLRYEWAIPVADSDEEAAHVLALALAMLFVTSGLSALGLALFGDSIPDWASFRLLKPYLWLIPIGLFGAGLFETLEHWAVRKEAYSRIARTNLTRGFVQAVGQAALGFTGIGALGLILGYTVGNSSGSMSLGALAMKRDRVLRNLRWSGVRSAAHKFRRFPAFSAPSSLINAAGTQLPSILLASVYGLKVAGFFLLTQRLMGLPMILLGKSMSQLYLGETARLSREDSSFVSLAFRRSVRRLFLIGTPSILAVGVLGYLLVPRIFGSQWQPAGFFLLLMVPMYLTQFVATPVAQATLNIRKRQDLQFRWDIARLSFVMTTVVAAARLGASASGAILVLSASMSVMYVLLLLIASPGKGEATSPEARLQQ